MILNSITNGEVYSFTHIQSAGFAKSQCTLYSFEEINTCVTVMSDICLNY